MQGRGVFAAQEMARLQAAGQVEVCTDVRACGRLVCEYEAPYSDTGEPAEVHLEPGDAEPELHARDQQLHT
jgi:hypothetical protein